MVKLDPEFVLEQVAKAPREFDVQARNPAHNVHIGGDHMVFSAVYGCPFVREGDVRRDAHCTTSAGWPACPRPMTSWTRPAG